MSDFLPHKQPVPGMGAVKPDQVYRECKKRGFLMRCDLRRAFSLFEILFATAIIGILAALLVPAVQRSVENAKGVKCLSQMKQIGAAIAQYEADNNGEIPPSNGTFYQLDWEGLWFSPLSRTGPASEPAGLAAYVGSRDALYHLSVCPLNVASGLPTAANPNPYGYPYVVTYPVMPTISSTGSPPVPYIPPVKRVQSLSQLSSLIVMMDSSVGPDWGVGFNTPTSGWTRVREPHSGKANVLWADHHVSAERKSDITVSNTVPPTN